MLYPPPGCAHPSNGGELVPRRGEGQVPLCGGVARFARRGGLFHCAGLGVFIRPGGVCIRYTRWGVHYARTVWAGHRATGGYAGGRIARWA